ncbi:uncharacterized protein LOC129927108 isoform X1 [Biomphalaria glabrata]|uniref:Uncharacterized protein LOC129927108 isoform X1 n=1 Tax=Biomphalaria glabrata TaxID=6526 RepID=A0A9W3ASU5_BIOGL|nr:uncharacterized protein LOC129927108 isoform X1 [Biomphalaria glabrata]
MQLHHIDKMLVQSVVPLLVLTMLSVSSTDGCYSSDFKLVERSLVEELLAERNLGKEYASLVLNDKRYLELKHELYKLEETLKVNAWHANDQRNQVFGGKCKKWFNHMCLGGNGKRSLEDLNGSTSNQSAIGGVEKQRNPASSSGQAKVMSKASFAVIVLCLVVQLFKRR